MRTVTQMKPESLGLLVLVSWISLQKETDLNKWRRWARNFNKFRSVHSSPWKKFPHFLQKLAQNEWNERQVQKRTGLELITKFANCMSRYHPVVHAWSLGSDGSKVYFQKYNKFFSSPPITKIKNGKEEWTISLFSNFIDFHIFLCLAEH